MPSATPRFAHYTRPQEERHKRGRKRERERVCVRVKCELVKGEGNIVNEKVERKERAPRYHFLFNFIS